MNRKLNIFLFIVGALLSILGAVFEFSASFAGIEILLLIIVGFTIGLLNIDETEEAGFLLSAMVFIFSVYFLTPYMNGFAALQNFSQILINFAILTAGATSIVSLRWVLNFTSSIKKTANETEAQRRVDLAKFERVWAVVMLIAVAVVLVQVVFESFFDTSPYLNLLETIDYVILAVFIIDLLIIYIETKNLSKFLKTAWLDIIATIPFNLFFRFFKLVRLVRVAKILKAQKVTKAIRMNRGLKFFSEKSKFNIHLHEKKKK